MNLYDRNIQDESSPWFDDDSSDIEEILDNKYDITVTPNDFNIATLVRFVELGAIRIPGFQRNFVWDMVRASKLIESLILGLPVPALYLYERSRNNFLVIDGHQRLMSIYYFYKQRFPRLSKRAKIRTLFDRHGLMPDEHFQNSEYFAPFELRLPSNEAYQLHGLNYSTLGEYKIQFDLRPIRNIVVKQNAPDNDDSMYEIFHRLNTGGLTLSPQEIRASLYHSQFYELLNRINNFQQWRDILGKEDPDLRMKDIEFLLRGFAMLVDQDAYKPSMKKFLNDFSKSNVQNSREDNEYLESLFQSFLDACSNLPPRAFFSRQNQRFSIMLYEAIFTVACEKCYFEKTVAAGKLDLEKIKLLKDDEKFRAASQQDTTGAVNVRKRIEMARIYIDPLQGPNEI